MLWLKSVFAASLAFILGLVPALGHELYVRLPALPTIPREAVVLFGGDMMFDRSVRVAMQEHGEDFVFSCLGDTFQKPDLTITNLEGPITAHESLSVGSKVGGLNNTKFTFAPSTAELIKRHGIDAVSIANNHAQDFGFDGVRSTIDYLNSAGIGYFGDPLREHMFTSDVRGVRFAVIGYNEFQTYLGGDVWQGSTTTLQKISDARASGYLPIVFAHWGTEYVGANAMQKKLAHAFIDAGAEMVVGAHPHVVQENEVYSGKQIYYSLGNLFFDQYFSEDVRSGRLLEATFNARGLDSIREIPVYLERDRRTCLITE